MNFSEVVKREMKEKKLKVPELARMTGCSIPYCYDLLKGRRRWNEDTIAKFSNALGIEVNFVIKEESSCPAQTGEE